jgi:hypothetical protein
MSKQGVVPNDASFPRAEISLSEDAKADAIYSLALYLDQQRTQRYIRQFQ